MTRTTTFSWPWRRLLESAPSSAAITDLTEMPDADPPVLTPRQAVEALL